METIYFVRVGHVDYTTVSINGQLHNSEWDDRHTKTFRIATSFSEASNVFIDGVAWSIVEAVIDGEETFYTEFDNSDFDIAGDITDHRDGTVSVTMGKMTDLEEAYELLYGGE